MIVWCRRENKDYYVWSNQDKKSKIINYNEFLLVDSYFKENLCKVFSYTEIVRCWIVPDGIWEKAILKFNLI